MLVGNGFFNNFLHTEGSVARGVEVSWLGVESTLSASPVFELIGLNDSMGTMFLLSLSPTLTMWPKEGTTLILMLLHEKKVTRLLRYCFGMTLKKFISE